MLEFILGLVVFVLVVKLFSSSKSKKIKKQLQSPFPLGNKNDKHYLFLDIESTGLLPFVFDLEYRIKRIPRIVQIAWKVFDSKGGFITGEDYIIKQKLDVPESAFNVHGISKEISLEKGVEFSEMASKLLQDMEGIEIMVAHNARFDMVILQAELIKNEYKYSLKKQKIHCTMLNTTNFCKIKKTTGHSGYKWPQLIELTKKVFTGAYDCELEVPGLHDASVDVHFTAKCYFKLMQQGFVFKNNSRKVWEGLNHPNELIDLN